VRISAGTAAADPASRETWVRAALWLVGATMLYNGVEAAVALAAGWKASSLALVGFGFDSLLEIAAAGVLLRRLRTEFAARGEDLGREERRVRRFVGGTFLALALYVAVQSVGSLVARRRPDESVLGIVLAVVSLTVMPVIALWKIRAAARVGSPALRAEAKETLACSTLSLCLLTGLSANALAGWWWADPAAAGLMVPWLVKEGLEGIRAQDCAC